MRRFLSALCILIVLVSCTLGNQEPDVVRIQFSDSTPKLIGYDGSLSLDGSDSIDTYRVGITDPQGTLTYSEWLSDTGYYEISGLIIGDTYTFTVDGAISMASGEPAIIATESVSHKVVSGTDTVTIALDEFVQAEATNLTVTITPPEDATGPITYTGVLTAPDGTGEIARTSTTSTTLTFEASNHDLTAGVYLLTVTADNGKDSWKAADAVRLLPNLPASGSISYIAKDAVNSDITIDDQTGHIIRFVRPDGTSPADEEASSWIGGTVTIDLSDTDATGSTYRVFVNGTELASTAWTVTSDVITLCPTAAMGFIDGRNVVTIFADNGTLFGKGSMDFGVEIGEAPDVVGVAWQYNESSPQLYRLYTSADAIPSGMKGMDDPYDLVTYDVTVEPVASENGNPGSSPFDEIGPWKDMKLVAMEDGGEVVDTIGGGETIRAFVDEHNNGSIDFMVYLPDAYLRVVDDSENSIRYYYVSDSEFDGSSLQPASGHYIGRYNGYIQEHTDGTSSDKLWSQPSGTSTAAEFASRLTHQEAYDVAHNRVSTVSGKIYGGLLWEEVSYVQLMYLVEYANLNSQDTLGYGDNDWQSGNSDDMPYHTGVLGSKTSYGSDVQYRYVEALFGADKGGDTVENLLVDDYVMYIAPSEKSLAVASKLDIFSNDGSGAAPSDWIAIGTMPSTGTGYITTMHYNEEQPWSIGVPSAASGGSSSSYASDFVFTASGLCSVRLSCNSYADYGAWSLLASHVPSYEDVNLSARLSFR